MLCKYKTIPLDEQTFVIQETTPVSNALCYLLCGADMALLIDTGLPIGNMKKIADSLTSLPIAVVNTHAHVDHMGANFRFDEVYLHEDDRDVFALHTDPGYIAELVRYVLPPSAWFLTPVLKRIMTAKRAGTYRYIKDGHVFRLGGRELEVIHTPGHSPGSICLLERAARRLFTGDTLCGHGILLDLAGCCTPEVYLASARRIQALCPDFDTILPGHHEWPVEKALVPGFAACAQGILDGTAEITQSRIRRNAKVGCISITLPLA